MITSLPRRNRPAKAKMTLRRKAGIVFCVTIVATSFVIALISLLRYLHDVGMTCMNQGVTIITHQGSSRECVGVTDGSYQFDRNYKELSRVENAIKTEDERVRTSGSVYVSIAYLMPISATGGVAPIQTVAEQLEGAYAAQYYANHHHNVQGTAPLIQLLIASSGTNATEYKPVVQVIENDVASQHLVAVSGIGVSLDTTIAEVSKLTTRSIPVFASSITSDVFDNIQNLVRVSPSNAEEISAVLSYIKPQVHTAFLIYDTNPADSYDTTITSEFRSDFPDRTHNIVAKESYNTAGEVSSSGPVAQEAANRLGQIPSDICVSKPDVVLFAGRDRDLDTLLNDLGNRPCLNQPVTIVTGDDVTGQTITTTIKQALETNVIVEYPSEADPREWQHGTGSVFQEGKQGFVRFREAFASVFPNAPYDDSAMIGYDATLTGITAIHLAGPDPRPAAVAQELSALQESRPVLGSSGPISFSADYQGPRSQGSNPVSKVIPILCLSSQGTPDFVSSYSRGVAAGTASSSGGWLQVSKGSRCGSSAGTHSVRR